MIGNKFLWWKNSLSEDQFRKALDLQRNDEMGKVMEKMGRLGQVSGRTDDAVGVLFHLLTELAYDYPEEQKQIEDVIEVLKRIGNNASNDFHTLLYETLTGDKAAGRDATR